MKVRLLFLTFICFTTSILNACPTIICDLDHCNDAEECYEEEE